MNPDNFLAALRQLSGPTLWITLALLAAAIVANLLYYRTLQCAMQAISPALRPFNPVLVWLSLIPFFGLFWYMIYAVMLSLGLQKELAARGMRGNGAIGVTTITIVLFALFLAPGLRYTVVFPALIAWAVHWQRMAMYRKLLADPVYLIVE
jgi:hypothetical protein